MKKPVLEPLFNNAAGVIKEDSNQVFSCEYCKIFKNTYFEGAFHQFPVIKGIVFNNIHVLFQQHVRCLNNNTFFKQQRFNSAYQSLLNSVRTVYQI